MSTVQVTSHRADLLISDRAGNPVATVELKNRKDMSRDVAVEFRRNLAAHGALESTPYFLLLSQDAGYLWRNAAPGDLLALPSAEFPMRAVVERYSPRRAWSKRLRESEFSALIFRWLQSLTQPLVAARDPAETTLDRLGLLEAMRGGAIVDQAVV